MRQSEQIQAVRFDRMKSRHASYIMDIFLSSVALGIGFGALGFLLWKLV